MSKKNTETKAVLCKWFEETLDAQLASSGFRRRKNSLVYRRILREARQQINITIEKDPKDSPDAAFAIYPWIEVSIDGVNRIASEMVNGNDNLLGLADVTLKQPLDFTSPKGIPARWFIYQSDSIPAVVSEMGKFLEKWGIPFLDFYSSPNAVCEAYDRTDARASSVLPAHAIRIAAAMLLVERFSDAVSVAEKWFGKAGPRKQYASVFTYLDSRKQIP